MLDPEDLSEHQHVVDRYIKQQHKQLKRHELRSFSKSTKGQSKYQIRQEDPEDLVFRGQRW